MKTVKAELHLCCCNLRVLLRRVLLEFNQKSEDSRLKVATSCSILPPLLGMGGRMGVAICFHPPLPTCRLLLIVDVPFEFLQASIFYHIFMVQLEDVLNMRWRAPKRDEASESAAEKV